MENINQTITSKQKEPLRTMRPITTTVNLAMNTKAKQTNEIYTNKFANLLLDKFNKDLSGFIITTEQKTRQQITEAFFKVLVQVFQDLKQLYDNGELNVKSNSVKTDAVFKNQDYDSIYRYLFSLCREIEASLYQFSEKQTKKDSPYFSKAKLLLIYLKKPNQVQLKLETITKTKEPIELCRLTEEELMSDEQKTKIENLQTKFLKDREIIAEKIYFKSHKGDIELNVDDNVAMPVAIQSDHESDNEAGGASGGNMGFNGYDEVNGSHDYDFSKGFNLLEYKRFLEGKVREILKESSANSLIGKLDAQTELLLKFRN